MKKILTVVLAMMLMIGIFAGCDKSAESSWETAVGGSRIPGTLPMPQGGISPAETTLETQPTAPEMAEASLNSLQQAMAETPQIFAVAYFGYYDTIDSDAPVDPYSVMQEQAPRFCEDLPFLLNIPADRVIGDNGDLFCVVPLDKDAIVAVSLGAWNEAAEEYEYEQSLYYSESGEPILFFCNGAGVEPDTQVYISGPSGEVIWYPMIDDNNCVAPLRNDDWENLFLDFSPYKELLMKSHQDMKDSEWVIPTADLLTGTTWVWNGYRKDGLDTKYRVVFKEDTLDVHWDDGLDEFTYEYPDAPWELAWTEVEGDRVEADPESEYISIFLNDADVMRITLDDCIFPRNSFVNKELRAYDGEMFSGCGNNQWIAYVGYMGPRDTIYSVTLLEDDVLLMELYWEVEGAPMVAHKWYRRIA